MGPVRQADDTGDGQLRPEQLAAVSNLGQDLPRTRSAARRTQSRREHEPGEMP